jgi:hypothetical protein
VPSGADCDDAPFPAPGTPDLAILELLLSEDCPSRGRLPRLGDDVPRFSPSESGGAVRVILIERCSGVQVGQDNDQYSVYQVRLPKVRIEPGQGLAEGLLSPDARVAAFSDFGDKVRAAGCEFIDLGVSAAEV